jgi:uncharacterized protein YgiM (DUF1202 family)
MRQRPLFINAAPKAAPIIAIAMWLTSGFCVHAEYVCLPRTYGGGDSYLVLRTGPGPQYPEIGPIANRAVLTVISQQDSWDYVQTAEGNTGWANRQGICVGAPPTER